MKEKDISVRFKEVEAADLTPLQARLVEEAKSATYRSYAPYSHFSVGSAIALDNGKIIAGSNQENAAFSSGTCAERSAAFFAHADNPDARFKAIAIAARGTDGQFTENPTAPCGHCRQALLEFEKLAGENVEVILAGRDKIYILPSVKSLLPLSFTEF